MSLILSFAIPLFISIYLLSPHLDVFIENYGFYATFLMVFAIFLSSFWLSFLDFFLFHAIYAGIFYVTSIYSHSALAIYCAILLIASLVGNGYLSRNGYKEDKLSMFLHFFIISVILLLVDFQFVTMSIPFFKVACVILPAVLFYFWHFYSILSVAYQRREEKRYKKK